MDSIDGTLANIEVNEKVLRDKEIVKLIKRLKENISSMKKEVCKDKCDDCEHNKSYRERSEGEVPCLQRYLRAGYVQYNKALMDVEDEIDKLTEQLRLEEITDAKEDTGNSDESCIK